MTHEPRNSERWSSGAAPAEAIDLEGQPLSVEERQRILSARRIKLTLSVFVVALLLVLSTVVFLGVTRIFDWLTPTIRHDLERKARRGVVELAQTAQIGMVVGDRGVVADAAADFVNDADVVGIVVLDAQGRRLLSHGREARRVDEVFIGQPQRVMEDAGAFSAWAPSSIEGTAVGRVAIIVSKARLEAGMSLRRDVLAAGAVSCLVALLVCLLFVNLYIGPILRFTSDVIRRLERTTDAALTAARIKSQFLANMSHEIRTPMNGIVGVLDLIRRTPLTSKQQRYTETMESSARSLLTIVDDILDFSKLEAGKYVLRNEDFALHNLAQEVVELLAPRAHAKDIELVLRVDAGVPHSIIGDPDRIKQVLTNLVGNAVKFTERGHVLARIDVESRKDDTLRLRFSVVDTGVGIAREDLGKLFGLFSQVDGSMTRRFGGTGLGLAISKRLVELMDGEIGVESQLGAGSTFWFAFDTRQGTLPAGPQPLPRNARVLLVSPDEAQRETTWDLLSGWGMSCVSAQDAEHATALLVESDAHPFDVAVVDGHFEAGDSFGLLDLCVTEGVPVVRLVSATQGRDAAGLNQVALFKPVRASELYNGIVSLIDGVPLLKRARPELELPAAAAEPIAVSSEEPVLVVDDNEVNRIVAVELLHDLGFRAEVACDGREAITKVERGRYAAILMDCQMPIMDGYEATQAIRALPGVAARVPIIALTAHAMVGDRQKVLAAGMDDYTSKPVRARALSTVLSRWIRAKPGAEAALLAPAAAAPATLPTDPASLVDLDPNIGLSPRVTAVFRELTPPLIDELERAAAARDVARVRDLGHKLKGSCLSVGALRLAAASHAVELAAKGGSLDAPAVAQLRPLFERVDAALLGAAAGVETSSGTNAREPR